MEVWCDSPQLPDLTLAPGSSASERLLRKGVGASATVDLRIQGVLKGNRFGLRSALDALPGKVIWKIVSYWLI